tara:strand:- start:545 stop:1702 length:1158 start_codon:yes stop_codon:yes gene_type:complete
MSELKTHKTINILYIFSFRSTIASWEKSGFLDREIKFFEEVSKNIDVKFHLLTYGNKKEKEILNNSNLEVLPIFDDFKNSSKIINLMKSFIYPLLNYKKLSYIDVIKVNQLSGSWVGLFFKFLLKKPLFIRTGYDAYLFSKYEKKPKYKQILFKRLTAIILKFADLYSVTSRSDEKFILDNYKFNNSKLVLRPNWVDTSYEFSQSNFDNRKCKLLSIGRLETQKNFMFLLKSLKDTGIEIDIVGSGSLKKNLIEFAEANNIKLKILDKVSNSEILNMLKNYKYFILPSLYEGNPKSLLEAMSSGCLVFASNINNNTEVIKDSYNGFLFGFDENFLKELLTSKILNDTNYSKILKNSLNDTRQNNSLDSLVNLEVDDYSLLINKKN